MKFKEYLRRAQFHGAKILVDTKFSWYWSISLIILLFATLTVVHMTIERFLSGPTYMTQTTVLRRRTMFPTVIICPEVSYPDYKMDKFVNEIRYPPSLNATYIRSVIVQLSAFASPDAVFNVEDLERIQELLDYNNLDIETASLRLTPTCEEILLKELKEMKVHDEQSKKKGYYVEKIGFTHSLMVAVQQRHDLSDIDLIYKWLALRPGLEYVDTTVNGTPISPGMETWFYYGTRTIEASEEILTLSSDLRGCSLNNEPLKYFPAYNKRYCLMECEMERTLRDCQCLKLAHPHLPGIPVCRARNLICSRDATVSYAIDECDCRTTCNVEHEGTKISSFDLNQDSPTYDSFYNGLDLKRVSIVRVFLPKQIERVFQRKSFYTTFNLFAQLGGVFNLFFGCSILILLELVLLAWRAVRSYF